MTNQTTDILIIGGGLTGLTLAYLLKQKNISAQIIEARDRLGGRIYTEYGDNGKAIEMGATWLGKKHTALTTLLKELGVGIFEQTLGDRAIYESISTSPPQLVELPPNNEPSFRIKGGSSTLINTLANQLNGSHLHLNQVVTSIEKLADKVQIKTTTEMFTGRVVVSTLPPNLLVNTVDFEPNLSPQITGIVGGTHTWMGESIKVGLTYTHPFWRAKNSGSTIFSNVGPIPEMYDHSNYEDTFYALKGFFNGNYFSVTRAERLILVLKQLRKYYGDVVDSYLSYHETVWQTEGFTFAPYSTHVLPHQNNGHTIYRQPYWEGQLFIAGSETAAHHPGYMDGAVSSARWVARQLGF